MSFVQMQLSSDKFLQMFREAIEPQFTALLDAEFPFQSAVLMVEQVEVLSGTSVDDSLPATKHIYYEEYTGPRQAPVLATEYVIVQPLRFVPVLMTGAGSPAPALSLLAEVDATLRVVLDARSYANRKSQLLLRPLDFAFDSTPLIPGVPSATVEQALRQVAQKVFASLRTIEQDLTPDTPPFGKLLYVNTGLAFDPDKTRVSILMQSRPCPEFLVKRWEGFHNRDIADLLQGAAGRHDWAQSVDRWIVEQGMISTFADGLKPKAGEFRPQCHYLNENVFPIN